MAPVVEKIVIVLLCAMLAWAFWRSTRPRLAFVVRIAAGRPAAIEGTITPAFLARLREMAASHGVATAEIVGYEYEGAIRLRFSRHVPQAAQQQLRNWWAMYGWRAAGRGVASRCG